MKKTPTKNDFASFSFSSKIFSAIQAAKYQTPTDVQEQAIPLILEGKDVLARAETGSGKTAAFVLPLLEGLIRRRVKAAGKSNTRKNVVGIVVLVPTRELAIQIREEFERFSEDVEPNIKCLSVYGGVKINPQMIALRGGADVLVATPGRLLDLEKNNAILLHQVRALVVDEVDRLMKGDFQQEIESIFKLMPKTRQNLMFTATFPASIRKLVRQIMNDPEIINVDDFYDDVAIKQRVFTVNHDQKNDLLAHLLKENDWKQVLVFCSAKRSCDNLVRKLEKRDVSAVAMHGNLQQNARARALKEFKAGEIRVLVATDVAGRGIDIGQLPCVINYELPRSPNDYTHRIGRTGRAGEQGIAISIISHNDYQHFKVIEKRNGIRLEREQVAGFEADENAPEMPKTRTQPKKKAKSKKRQALANKKELSKQKKKSQALEVKQAEARAKKEKYKQKDLAERKAAKKPKADSPSQSEFYGKPAKQSPSESYVKPEKPTQKSPEKSGAAKSEKVVMKEEAPAKPPSGASLYTRKLPKVDD